MHNERMKKAIESEKVAELLMRPALRALESSDLQRNCARYPDEEHLRVGIERVIQNRKSGRSWITWCRLTRGITVRVRTFFKALESSRRMHMV